MIKDFNSGAAFQCLAKTAAAVLWGSWLLLSSDPVCAEAPPTFREYCDQAHEPFEIPLLWQSSESKTGSYTVPSSEGNEWQSDPQKVRYGLLIDGPSFTDGDVSIYKVWLIYDDPKIKKAAFFELEMDREHSEVAPRIAFPPAPSSISSWKDYPKTPHFNLVLYKLNSDLGYQLVAPPTDSDKGCLSHVLASLAVNGAFKAVETNHPVSPQSLLLTRMDEPLKSIHKKWFPAGNKPFWVIHSDPLQNSELPSEKLIAVPPPHKSAGAQPVIAGNPPPDATPVSPDSALPNPSESSASSGALSKSEGNSVRPKPTPPAAMSNTSGQSANEEGKSPATDLAHVWHGGQPAPGSQNDVVLNYRLRIVEHGIRPEEDPRPDFEFIKPELQRRLCLTIDKQTPLPLDWNDPVLKLNTSELNLLSVGELEELSDVNDESEQSRAHSPQAPSCLSFKESRLKLEPGSFDATLDPVSGSAGDEHLRIQIRVPRVRHRISVREVFKSQSREASADGQKFNWTVEFEGMTQKRHEGFGDGVEKELIEGFQLDYFVESVSSARYASPTADEIKKPVAAGKGDVCRDAPNGPCYQVEVTRVLATTRLLVSGTEEGPCVSEQLPKYVRVRTSNSETTKLWPDAETMELPLGQAAEVPVAWYPLTAALRPDDVDTWKIKDWKLTKPGDSPERLIFLGKPSRRSVPITLPGLKPPAGSSMEVTLSGPCIESSGPIPVTATTTSIPLMLPFGHGTKAISSLKRFKNESMLELRPPRGMRLKGCGSEKATCRAALETLWTDKGIEGIELDLVRAPTVTLLYVFLSRHIADPEALYNELKERVGKARKVDPQGTLRLVVTDGRTIAEATDDPTELRRALQNVLEWPARGIAPQVLEKLDTALLGVHGLRRDWLELKLQLFIPKMLWEDIGQEKEWIAQIVEKHKIQGVTSELFDVSLRTSAGELQSYATLPGLNQIP